jgi:2,3-bisphosphoglycerate-independent phosphoglycerate mutase
MDMVGHTGFFDATVQAVEAVDDCIGKVITTLQAEGGEALIIADHGNAEQMFDSGSNQPHTAHSCNPVRCICVSRRVCSIDNGILADVSPTILELLGLKQPAEMTGKSLIRLQNH